MAFTVVIPVHNKRPHLERCLRSVWAQTRPCDELIVVDDLSTDGSREYLSSLGENIRLLLREEPGPGGYAARNFGIQAATHDWICFLDADDEWSESYLATLEATIAAYPNEQVFASAWTEYDSTIGYAVCRYRLRNNSVSRITPEEYLRLPPGAYPAWTSSVCIRRELLLSVGGFPAGVVKRGGDVDTWLRCLLSAGGLVWNPQVAAIYHKQSVNMVTKSVPFVAFAERSTAVTLLATRGHHSWRPRSLKIFVNNRILSGFLQACKSEMDFPSRRPPVFLLGLTAGNALLMVAYVLPLPLARVATNLLIGTQNVIKRLLRSKSGQATKQVVRFARDLLAYGLWLGTKAQRGLSLTRSRVTVPGYLNNFVGYFDVSCLRPGEPGQVLLACNNHFPLRAHSPTTQTDIVLHDTRTKQSRVLGHTRSWNWQQAARQQWIDRNRIVYNRDFSGVVRAVCLDVETGQELVLEHAVQAMAPGRYATLNYETLDSLKRNDYGYKLKSSLSGVVVQVRSLPEDQPLYAVGLDDIRALLTIVIGEHAHLNHLLFSPSGNHLVVLLRFETDGVLRHNLLLLDLVSRRTSCLLQDQFVSHYMWVDDVTVLYWGERLGVRGYYQINVVSRSVELVSESPLDGHPSRIHGDRILTDTYKLAGSHHHLLCLDLKSGQMRTIGHVPEAPYFNDSTRCDLHAKVDQGIVQFDSRVGLGRRVVLNDWSDFC